MKVSLNGLQKGERRLLLQNTFATARVSLSGRTVLGSQLSQFEKEFSAYNRASFAVGVGNGLDALSIGLRGLGIGPGDEIIVPAVTALATSLAVLAVGATPVLADICKRTGHLDIESVRSSISSKTRGIILVHLYGLMYAVDDFESLAKEHGLHLIEDAAQAHGAEFRGMKSGSYGRFAAFSFYPTKNLGALGDGGALITNDENLALFAKQFRNYGQKDRYTHEYPGVNSRLDEVQAAILRQRLRDLDSQNCVRRSIAMEYERRICNPAVQVLHKGEFSKAHVVHLFVVTSQFSSDLASYLQELGIESQKHYPIPAHQQPAMLGRFKAQVSLLQSEELSKSCLSLPLHPYMTRREVNYVIRMVNEFVPNS